MRLQPPHAHISLQRWQLCIRYRVQKLSFQRELLPVDAILTWSVERYSSLHTHQCISQHPFQTPETNLSQSYQRVAPSLEKYRTRFDPIGYEQAVCALLEFGTGGSTFGPDILEEQRYR